MLEGYWAYIRGTYIRGLIFGGGAYIWGVIFGGGAYIWNEVSVSTCGGPIDGGAYIRGAYSRSFTVALILSLQDIHFWCVFSPLYGLVLLPTL